MKLMKAIRTAILVMVLGAFVVVMGCKTMDKLLGVQPNGTNAPAGLPDSLTGIVKTTGSFFGPYGEAVGGVLLLAATAYVNQRRKKALEDHIAEFHSADAPPPATPSPTP